MSHISESDIIKLISEAVEPEESQQDPRKGPRIGVEAVRGKKTNRVLKRMVDLDAVDREVDSVLGVLGHGYLGKSMEKERSGIESERNAVINRMNQYKEKRDAVLGSLKTPVNKKAGIIIPDDDANALTAIMRSTAGIEKRQSKKPLTTGEINALGYKNKDEWDRDHGNREDAQAKALGAVQLGSNVTTNELESLYQEILDKEHDQDFSLGSVHGLFKQFNYKKIELQNSIMNALYWDEQLEELKLEMERLGSGMEKSAHGLASHEAGYSLEMARQRKNIALAGGTMPCFKCKEPINITVSEVGETVHCEYCESENPQTGAAGPTAQVVPPDMGKGLRQEIVDSLEKMSPGMYSIYLKKRRAYMQQGSKQPYAMSMMRESMRSDNVSCSECTQIITSPQVSRVLAGSADFHDYECMKCQRILYPADMARQLNGPRLVPKGTRRPISDEDDTITKEEI